MKFFVALFVFTCVVLGNAQDACHCDYPGDGGVLNDAGDGYKPDSVLCWVDIARLSKDYANERALEWLDTWITASQLYNEALKGDFKLPSVAGASINLANRCFCNLKGNIINNDALSEWYGSVCKDFGALLNAGDDKAINDYMIDAYPKFKSLICQSSN